MNHDRQTRFNCYPTAIVVVALCGVLFGTVALSSAGASESISARPATTTNGHGIQVIGGPSFRFGAPTQIVAANGDMWIANLGGNPGLTEISSSTGRLVRVIKNPAFVVGDMALAWSGKDIWSAPFVQQGESIKNRVFEINPTNGDIVRTIRAPADEISQPESIVVSSGDIWIANAGGGSVGPGQRSYVTELAPNGSLVRVLSPHLVYPDAVAVAHGHVWVLGTANYQLTEFTSANGHYVKSISLPRTGTPEPNDLLVVGPNLWIPMGEWIDVVSATTGKVTRTIKLSHSQVTSGSYNQHAVVVGAELFLTTGYLNTVLEINMASGTVVRVIAGAAYAFKDPWGIAVSGGDLWVSNNNNSGEGSVTRFPIP